MRACQNKAVKIISYQFFLLTILFIVVITLMSGCAKSVDAQVSEQMELGQKYLAELSYEEAVIAFQKVIDLEPYNIEAYRGLAEAYHNMGKETHEMAALEDAVQVISSNYAGAPSLDVASELFLRLTNLYVLNGKTDKAKKIADKADQLGIQIDYTVVDSQENVAGTQSDESDGGEIGEVTEESQTADNENILAGFLAAMKYPEGRRKEAEQLVGDGMFPGNSIHWFVNAFSFDVGYGVSDLIDHGDYYEVTNCLIEFPYILSPEEVAKFEDGYEFETTLYDQNGNKDTIHGIVKKVGGDWWLTPDGSSENEDSCYSVEMDSEGNWVIRTIVHGEYALGIIYRGSLFFSKDGLVHDTRFNKTEIFDEYSTKEHDYMESDFQGGMREGNHFSFFGEIIFDPDTGLIVECEEVYQA